MKGAVSPARRRGTDAAGLAGIAPSRTARSSTRPNSCQMCLIVPRARPRSTRAARKARHRRRHRPDRAGSKLRREVVRVQPLVLGEHSRLHHARQGVEEPPPQTARTVPAALRVRRRRHYLVWARYPNLNWPVPACMSTPDLGRLLVLRCADRCDWCDREGRAGHHERAPGECR